MEFLEKSIAVLMTCHNRKDKTLNCLKNLLAQECIQEIRMDIFLVDDGSTDGTALEVSKHYPFVRIIKGSGTLYWCGGMRLAIENAISEGYDFYLWLNDDTILYNNALINLLRTFDKLVVKCKIPPIVVGNLCDPATGELTYGGFVRASRWYPLRFIGLLPTSEPQRCDVFNGNCVLIPNEAVRRIGNIHPKLIHAKGDYEYALRAGQCGVSKWVAPHYIGECQRNSENGTWVDSSLSLHTRYKKLFSVKGDPPIPRMIYYSRYGGPLWMIFYPLVYLRPLLATLRTLLFKQT